MCATLNVSLDQSQLAFCKSEEANIRLLAPAGCGKTTSLLHRCLELTQQSERKPRFLIVTFTRGAAAELKHRLVNEPEFAPMRGQVTIETLNAWGWNRIRNSDLIKSAKLLKNNDDLYFAMRNQLRPVWAGNEYVEPVASKVGEGPRRLMQVMDNLKSLGFVHTKDTNRQLFDQRLEDLTSIGLSWRIQEQFDLLTDLGVLSPSSSGDGEGASTSRRQFYDRFFIFWRNATARLLEEATFTFEDQKYWNYLNMAGHLPGGRVQREVTGAARYDHVLVDEFQDINPLDLALVKSITFRHNATLTIVGDDDQAIFEWRGATPQYILDPQRYFGISFSDHQLGINYRSPENIVDLGQRLIGHNKNRVNKLVKATEGAKRADVRVQWTDGISHCLEVVTGLVDSTPDSGKVALIGRLRRQLIPYEIHFASEGAPFKVAADLDVLGSKAMDDLGALLEVWQRAKLPQRAAKATEDAIAICDNARRRPMSRVNREDINRYLLGRSPRTVADAIGFLATYDGPKLTGKSHIQLYEIGSSFLNARDASTAIRVMEDEFDGLQFDRERAEDDIFFTDPPLLQLADIVESEGWDVEGLIDRIERAKHQVREMRALDDRDMDDHILAAFERPLHLMTATRAKGKEFDTVVILEPMEGIWPHNRAKSEREIEAERRLFYVAFTRARRRVVLLAIRGSEPLSRFVHELGEVEGDLGHNRIL